MFCPQRRRPQLKALQLRPGFFFHAFFIKKEHQKGVSVARFCLAQYLPNMGFERVFRNMQAVADGCCIAPFENQAQNVPFAQGNAVFQGKICNTVCANSRS